jgi:hypothetical protein
MLTFTRSTQGQFQLKQKELHRMSTTYNETRVNYQPVVAGGQRGEVEYSVKEEKVQELMEEITTKADGSSLDVLTSQTFTFHQVSETDPVTDFVAFVTDVEEQANLINRAIVLKQQQYVRRLLVSKDFTPVEGAYDLQSVIGLKSERVSATPEQKAANALSKLLGRQVAVDELANIIASLGAAA